jgi:hypothetical protein
MKAAKDTGRKYIDEALRLGKPCVSWVKETVHEQAARLYAEYRPEVKMDERLELIAKEYELTPRDVQIVYRKFLRIDSQDEMGRTGDIEVSEFYEWISLDRTLLSDGGFEVVNVSLKNTIDFGDFLHMICNFCIMSDEEILKFTFRCFDKENAPHGFMVREKFEEMVHNFHKDSIGYHNAMNALELAVDKQLLFLNWDRVQQIHKMFPLLLFPAYLYQHKLVDMSWGQSWWSRKRRQMHFRRKKIRRQVARDRMMEIRKLTKERKHRFKLLAAVMGEEGKKDFAEFVREGMEHGHGDPKCGAIEDIRLHEARPREEVRCRRLLIGLHT